MYVVCVTFEILPQHFPAFQRAVLQQAKNSLEREPDCQLFDVCSNVSANSVFLYEQYTDRAAFDDHLHSAHFLDFDAQTRPWVQNKRVACWQLLEQNT